MTQSGQKNLLIITDTCWPALGGIENAILSLSQNLADDFRCSILTHSHRSNSVTLYNRYRSPSPQPQLDPSGNAIKQLNVSFLKRIFLLPLLLWDLPGIKRIIPAPVLFDILYIIYKFVFFRDLKRHILDADLVHSFSTGWLSRLAGEICKKAAIPIVHSPAVHFNKWGDSPAQLQSYIQGNALICFSEMMKNTILSRTSVNPLRCHVIPPVISTTAATQQSYKRLIEAPYILFLGRREQHKGLHLLIDAFCKIQLPVKLVIAGPGEKYTGENESIIDLGQVTNEIKASLLSYCEFFALPSSDESFGIVYTEAMSYGKPVIAIDIPPVNEIVTNGVTGILIPPSDIDALSTALKKLSTDHQLRKTMCEKAFEAFQKRYDHIKVTTDIVSIYKQCLM